VGPVAWCGHGEKYETVHGGGHTPPHHPHPLARSGRWENYRSANEMGDEMAGGGEVGKSQPEREKLARSLIHCFQKSS